MEAFNLQKLNEGQLKEQYQVTVTNKFAVLMMETSIGHGTPLERISKFPPTSVSVIVKHNKSWFDEEF
jgi:hypothetical protein